MQAGIVQSALENTHFYLRLCGDVRLPWCVTLENFCQEVIASNPISTFSIDLTRAVNLDSTTLGILAKVMMLAGKSVEGKPRLYCTDDNIYRLLWSMGFEHIAEVVREPVAESPVYTDVELVKCNEEDIRSSVIAAHEELMDIDNKNINKFKGLVENLKK